MPENTPTQVVSVAPFDDAGRMLMGLRNEEQAWNLPGGHVEPGESPIRAAVRELLEETGLRPGVGGLEFLARKDLVTKEGKTLRIFSFRTTGVQGTPTGENDPDAECDRWEWVDVSNGLPKEIEDNLYNAQDVTLQALGFQAGPMRKFEVPPDLISRLPSLARLMKNDVFPLRKNEASDRERAEALWEPVDRMTDWRSWVAGQGLSEREKEISLGTVDALKLLIKTPLTNFERELLLQRTLRNTAVIAHAPVTMAMFGGESPAHLRVESPWTEDQNLRLIEGSRFNGPLLSYLMGSINGHGRELTDSERAAVLDGNSSANGAGRILDLLSGRSEAARKNFGWAKMTGDQLDALVYSTRNLRGMDVRRASLLALHPNLSQSTVDELGEAALRGGGDREAQCLALAHPKANEKKLYQFIRQEPSDLILGGLLDRVPVARLAPVLPDLYRRDEARFFPYVREAVKSLPEVPKDLVQAIAKNPETGVLDALLKRPDSTVAMRRQIYKPEYAGSPTADALLGGTSVLPPEEMKKLQTWHRELMDGDDPHAALQAFRLGDQEPTPAFLSKIDQAYQGVTTDGNFSPGMTFRADTTLLDVLRDAILHSTNDSKWKGVADVLAKNSALGNREAMDHLVDLAGGDPEGRVISPEHLDSILKQPPLTSEQLDTDDLEKLRHRAVKLPQVTGQQFFDFLQSNPHVGMSRVKSGTPYYDQDGQLQSMGSAEDMVNVAAQKHMGKLTNQQALALLDAPSPLASKIGAKSPSLKKEDIASYLSRPNANLGAAQRLMFLSPNFDVGHLQQMIDDRQPSYINGPPESSLLRTLVANNGLNLHRPELVRHAYHHLMSTLDKQGQRAQLFRGEGVFANPVTPSDVLLDAERRLRGEVANRHLLGVLAPRYNEILNHQNLDLDHFKELLDSPARPVLDGRRIEERAGEVHPDLLYKSRVAVKPGTERLREIRDKILQTDPLRAEIPPRHLPPGDWSAGRLPNGNISAKLLQAHIDKLPVKEFNVSASKWTGLQRHSMEPSKVFQLNITTNHLQEMRAKGLLGVFRKMIDASYTSQHPVTKQTIGWARFTGDAKRGIFIDEIQSDFGGTNGRTFVQKARSQAQAHAKKEEMSYEKASEFIDTAVKRAEQQFPEAAEKEIGNIIFGGRPTNQVIHEAFLQHLRDTGHEGVPVHMHSVETKAPISLGSEVVDVSTGSLRQDAKIPAHMKETYGEQPRKMGYKPVRYGDIPATSDTEAQHGHLEGGPIINGTVIRKNEDDEALQAAFRSKSDGTLIVTGTVHDLLALPDGIGTNLDDFQDGFVDEQGKFLTRAEAVAQATPPPLEKKRRSVETQLAMALVKMAVDAKDLGPVRRYTDDDAGMAAVDDSQEEKAHPGHLEAEAQDFRRQVLDSSKVVRRTSTRQGLSNSTGKVIYDVKSSEEKPTRYMVKPYHEKIVPRMRAWHHAPVQGWAEMTNQALYHAGGIGDLHQGVHVARLPTDGSQGTRPALVIKMTPGVQDLDSLIHFQPKRGQFTDNQRAQARQVALMDFLSNNLDRHANNMMIDPQADKILAIDHSRSFQYKNKEKDPPPRDIRADIDDRLANYINAGGLKPILFSSEEPFVATPELLAMEAKARRGETNWAEAGSYRRELESRHKSQQMGKWTEGWEPTFDWWQAHSEGITDVFKRRLKIIRDDTFRDHMWRNFQARKKVLDEYARDGHENYGYDDWHHFSVPIFRLGSKLHENDEFSHWFEPWSDK